MGSPRPKTRLTQTLTLLYGMTDDERDDLAREIERTRVAVWRKTIQEEALKFGSRKPVSGPSGQDLATIRRQSIEDARSIQATYNRDVAKQLDKLYRQNPRGNRNYYISNMETWATDRQAYKGNQIALNTESTARQFARDLFRQVNGIRGGKYRYAGPAPVSDECKRRFGAGVVDGRYIENNPVPAHVNCPHDWEQVERPPLPPNTRPQDLWVG